MVKIDPIATEGMQSIPEDVGQKDSKLSELEPKLSESQFEPKLSELRYKTK